MSKQMKSFHSDAKIVPIQKGNQLYKNLTDLNEEFYKHTSLAISQMQENNLTASDMYTICNAGANIIKSNTEASIAMAEAEHERNEKEKDSQHNRRLSGITLISGLFFCGLGQPEIGIPLVGIGLGQPLKDVFKAKFPKLIK